MDSLSTVGSIGVEVPIQFARGTDFSVLLTFKNPRPPKGDGLAIDLTGAAIQAYIRKRGLSKRRVVAFTATIVDAAAGQVSLSLSAAQTAAIPCGESIDSDASSYVYDARLTDSLGRKIATIYGAVEVFRDVTHDRSV